MEKLTLAGLMAGTGRTFLSVSLAHMLVRKGNRVLFVDLVPPTLTSGSLLAAGASDLLLESGWEDSFRDRGRNPDFYLRNPSAVRSCMVKSLFPNMMVLPACVELAGREPEMLSDIDNLQGLSLALRFIDNDFDVVIVDTAPGLGFYSTMAVMAADTVLVPCVSHQRLPLTMDVTFRAVEQVRLLARRSGGVLKEADWRFVFNRHDGTPDADEAYSGFRRMVMECGHAGKNVRELGILPKTRRMLENIMVKRACWEGIDRDEMQPFWDLLYELLPWENFPERTSPIG